MTTPTTLTSSTPWCAGHVLNTIMLGGLAIMWGDWRVESLKAATSATDLRMVAYFFVSCIVGGLVCALFLASNARAKSPVREIYWLLLLLSGTVTTLMWYHVTHLVASW